MTDSLKRIGFIDYLRGIAIVSVYLYHCLGTAYGYYTLPWYWINRTFHGVPWTFSALLPIHFGFIGVPIFFVVSGFCIHLSFEQQGREWGSFFIRRFFRIYPAYLFAVLIFSFFYAYTARDFWFQFKYHALLVHNYNPGTLHTLSGVFWSVAIEVQLYLLYPLLRALISKFGWRRTLVCVAAGEILLQGWDGLVDQITIYSGYASPFLLHKVTPLVDNYLRTSPLAYWFSWSLGAFTADAFLKNRQMPLAKSSTWFWIFLVIASYFIAAICCYFFLLSAVLTTKIIGNYLARRDSCLETSNFWKNQLRLTGLWSYSIYLLHEPVLQFLTWVLRHFSPEINPFLAFLYCVGCWLIIMPLAGIWYRVFEKPGIAFGKTLIRKIADKRMTAPITPP